MRRWLAVFLLVFLPLQFAWAAAAGYCQHETDAAAQHLGHHQHQHDADGDGVPDSPPLDGTDNDCGTCHAGGVVAIVADLDLPHGAGVAPAIAWSPGSLTSLPAAEPERPNWFARAWSAGRTALFPALLPGVRCGLIRTTHGDAFGVAPRRFTV
jgi:hypothetical protein